jgi:hypothetical protein
VLSDVRPLPGGLCLATCECGEERRFRNQEQAWKWLIDHLCYLDERSLDGDRES